MASPAELLAQAASALVHAAAAMPVAADPKSPKAQAKKKAKPKPKDDDEDDRPTGLISPRSIKGSNFKDFPRLVQQMGKR